MHTYWFLHSIKSYKFVVKVTFYRLSLSVYPQSIEAIEPEFYQLVNEILISTRMVLRTYHSDPSLRIVYNPEAIAPEALNRRGGDLEFKMKDFYEFVGRIERQYPIPPVTTIMQLQLLQPYIDLKNKLLKIYKKRLNYFAIEIPKWIELVRAQRHRVLSVQEFDACVRQSERQITYLRVILHTYQLGRYGEYFNGIADRSCNNLDICLSKIGRNAILEPPVRRSLR